MYQAMDLNTITVGALGVRFLVDAADSNGTAAVFECDVPANARMPAPHSHEGFEETIYGLEGVTESSEQTKLRHDLALAFTDLGGATFALAHHHALTDKRLASRVQRIHDLYAQLGAITHARNSRPHNDEQPADLAA